MKIFKITQMLINVKMVPKIVYMQWNITLQYSSQKDKLQLHSTVWMES